MVRVEGRCLACVIASNPPLAADTNQEALLTLTAVPCLGEIPYVEDLAGGITSLADLFEGQLNLRPLDPALPHK